MHWSSRGGSTLGVDVAADRRPTAQLVSPEKLVRLRKALEGLGLYIGEADPSTNPDGFCDVVIAAAESLARANPEFDPADASAATEGAMPVSMSLTDSVRAGPLSQQKSDALVNAFFDTVPRHRGA